MDSIFDKNDNKSKSKKKSKNIVKKQKYLSKMNKLQKLGVAKLKSKTKRKYNDIIKNTHRDANKKKRRQKKVKDQSINSNNDDNKEMKVKKSVSNKSDNEHLKHDENAYLLAYKLAMKNNLSPDIQRILDPKLDHTKRDELFDQLSIMSDLIEDYSWAIPTKQAINIIKHFSPIVEIGAGNGYWGSLLIKHNCKYIGYDKSIAHNCYISIKNGGPTVLKTHKKSTLFLCYPDDFENSDQSLAYECLKYYEGEFIICVGEWFGQTFQANSYGKSFSAEFQEALCSEFHCILKLPLPSWISTIDTLSVWKRSELIEIDELNYKYVPTDEQIPINISVAPKYQHFFKG